MSDGGWFLDPTNQFDFAANQPIIADQFTHFDYTLPPLNYDGSQNTDWWANFAKAIPVIGQTFASTYNAVNNPSTPSAYQSPQGSGAYAGGDPNAPPPGSGFDFSQFANFATPYPYVAIGAVVLLIVLMKKR